MFYQHRKRSGGDFTRTFPLDQEFTKEEIESCMRNMPPGSPNLAVLSFAGGFHGRTLGTLSMTRSKVCRNDVFYLAEGSLAQLASEANVFLEGILFFTF